MPVIPQRETAKILAFPLKGRKTFGDRNESTGPTVDLSASALRPVSIGSGWYHDAAIAEAETTRTP